MQEHHGRALPALDVVQPHAINFDELPFGRIGPAGLVRAVLHPCSDRRGGGNDDEAG
ncbi:MAG TPA: hypothetical protein VK570_13100 [Rubrivivax sp.]|nr:hypothetical protein [Rubrivivax sp.]